MEFSLELVTQFDMTPLKFSQVESAESFPVQMRNAGITIEIEVSM